MSVQSSQLPSFTQPVAEARPRETPQVRERDNDEFSGLMKEQQVKKRDEVEPAQRKEPAAEREDVRAREPVEERETLADKGKDLPSEKKESAGAEDGSGQGSNEDAPRLATEEPEEGDEGPGEPASIDALLGQLRALEKDTTEGEPGLTPGSLLTDIKGEPGLTPGSLLTDAEGATGLTPGPLLADAQAQRGDSPLTEQALAAQQLDTSIPSALSLAGSAALSAPELTGQTQLQGQAQSLFQRLQGDLLNNASNPTTSLNTASWASQLQALQEADGKGFDDLMQRGFSGFRDPSGSLLGPQLGGDEALKGFNQIMSQMNAARPAAAASAALETAASTTQQPRPLEVPVGSKQWGEGVGERIQWMMNRGMDQAQIRLNPQHLGPLEIRLSMTNDQANVSIMAQHAITRDAIEQSLPRLREMLQDANLNLGNVDVGQREAAPQREQAQRDQGPDGRGFGEDGDELLDGDEELTANTAPRQKLGLISEFA